MATKKSDIKHPEHMLSINSAAIRIGCHPDTIRRRISDGSLTAYRFGPRLIRVDINEVMRMLRIVPNAGNL